MDLKNQHASPQDADIESKKATALELRIAGASYRAIARQMGIGKTTAQEYVIGALEEIREQNREAAEELKRIELERLDSLLVALWPKRANPRTADTILRVSERRARLLGLDVGRGSGDDPDALPPGAMHVMPGAFQITLVTPGGQVLSPVPALAQASPAAAPSGSPAAETPDDDRKEAAHARTGHPEA